jgi:hypothetical protein
MASEKKPFSDHYRALTSIYTLNPGLGLDTLYIPRENRPSEHDDTQPRPV